MPCVQTPNPAANCAPVCWGWEASIAPKPGIVLSVKGPDEHRETSIEEPIVLEWMVSRVSWGNKHRKIVWALLMRELSTRYGRNNIGFLWLLGEPIIFASGVSIMWSAIRPPYENGIKLIPFIVTGYMPLILIRQTVNYSIGAVKNNAALLFHRNITPLHLIISRIFIEFIGVTLASIVIITIYNILGVMSLPKNFSELWYIYVGWIMLAWLSGALAMASAALAEIFDFVERFVQISTYVIIPISGAFFMAANMPSRFRDISLSMPFIHEFELIRRGYFGAGVSVIYNIPYALCWCVGLTLIGLILVHFVRGRVEVE